MSPERGRERQLHRDDILREAVDLATSDRVDLVVIVGDLFDGHDPETTVLDSCLLQLGRLLEAGIPLVTVPGIHDEITYPTSVFRARAADWPGMLLLCPEPSPVGTLDLGGVPCHLTSMAWTGGPSRSLEAFPRGEGEGIHVALFHGRLGAVMPGGRGPFFDVEALGRAGYDYVALGGVHRREVRHLEGTTVVYPGLVDSLGFDEPGVACLTLARVEPGQVEVLTRPVATQPVFSLSVDASGLEQGEIEARIRRMINPNALVRVTLQGGAAGRVDTSRLLVSLADAFFHLEIVDATDVPEEARLSTWSSELTILGQFVRRMQDRVASASSERERRVLERALRKGVEALQAEMER